MLYSKKVIYKISPFSSAIGSSYNLAETTDGAKDKQRRMKELFTTHIKVHVYGNTKAIAVTEIEMDIAREDVQEVLYKNLGV